MSEILAENPYPSEHRPYEQYAFTSDKRAYEQGFYDGNSEGFDLGKVAQLRQVVEWLEKHGELRLVEYPGIRRYELVEAAWQALRRAAGMEVA